MVLIVVTCFNERLVIVRWTIQCQLHCWHARSVKRGVSEPIEGFQAYDALPASYYELHTRPYTRTYSHSGKARVNRAWI